MRVRASPSWARPAPGSKFFYWVGRAANRPAEILPLPDGSVTPSVEFPVRSRLSVTLLFAFAETGPYAELAFFAGNTVSWNYGQPHCFASCAHWPCFLALWSSINSLLLITRHTPKAPTWSSELSLQRLCALPWRWPPSYAALMPYRHIHVP